jgi:hypothetical protein
MNNLLASDSAWFEACLVKFSHSNRAGLVQVLEPRSLHLADFCWMGNLFTARQSSAVDLL